MTQEPGTSTQYYTVARPNADDLSETQFTQDGRTWQCGGLYWDDEQNDLFRLQRVVRKSSWCDTGPAEEGTPHLRFSAAFSDQTMEIPLTEGDVATIERFKPRKTLPYRER